MKKALFFLSLLATSLSLWAQTPVDPQDQLYSDLQVWYSAGLIQALPALRPYPLQVIKPALEQVAQKGSTAQQAKAKSYLALFGGPNSFRINPYAQARADDSKDTLLRAGAKVSLDSWLSEIVTGSFVLDAMALRSSNTDNPYLLPFGEKYPVFITEDNASLGGLKIRPALITNFTVGNSQLYFNAGLMRNDFGPFWTNGVFLGAQSPEAPSFNLSWTNGLFTSNILYSVIQATNAVGGDLPKGKFAHKNFVFHSYGVKPVDWFEFNFVENVTFGRFDPMYFTPLTVLFINQLIGDDGDHCNLGFTLEFKLPEHFKADVAFNLDDAQFNDLVKLNFNTKLRAGVQTGVSWTPLDALIRQIRLDYTAVTPFAFTAENYITPGYGEAAIAQPNYRNRMNSGVPLGAILKPNSDRLTLRAEITPLDNLLLTVQGRMIRHGNANEGTTHEGWAAKYGIEEGGYYDTGFHANNGDEEGTGGTTYAYQNSNPFLSQSVLEIRAITTVEASYEFTLGVQHSVYLNGGVTLEKVWNKDLVKNREDLNTYFDAGASYVIKF